MGDVYYWSFDLHYIVIISDRQGQAQENVDLQFPQYRINRIYYI